VGETSPGDSERSSILAVALIVVVTFVGLRRSSRSPGGMNKTNKIIKMASVRISEAIGLFSVTWPFCSCMVSQRYSNFITLSAKAFKKGGTAERRCASLKLILRRVM